MTLRRLYARWLSILLSRWCPSWPPTLSIGNPGTEYLPNKLMIIKASLHKEGLLTIFKKWHSCRYRRLRHEGLPHQGPSLSSLYSGSSLVVTTSFREPGRLPTLSGSVWRCSSLGEGCVQKRSASRFSAAEIPHLPQRHRAGVLDTHEFLQRFLGNF